MKITLAVPKIKQKSEETFIQHSFKFGSINPSQIKLLSKNIDSKKATVADKIPSKVLKLTADFLSNSLSDSINISLTSWIFPGATKIAAVSSIDKGTDNKNIVSNFRPVSVLGPFSKRYELTKKNQLIPHLDKVFPLISQLTVRIN